MYQLALIPVLILFLMWGAYEKGRADQAVSQSVATSSMNTEIGALNASTASADATAAIERDRLARKAMEALEADLKQEAGAVAVTSAASTATAGRAMPNPGPASASVSAPHSMPVAGAPVFSPVYRFSEQDIARLNAIK